MNTDPTSTPACANADETTWHDVRTDRNQRLPSHTFAVLAIAAMVAAGCQPPNDTASVTPAVGAPAGTDVSSIEPEASREQPPAPARPDAAQAPAPATHPSSTVQMPENPPASGVDAQSAATVAETYFAKLREGDNVGADQLWGPNNVDAAAAFRRRFTNSHDAAANVGAPGAMEGAAGSLYITVPARISGLAGSKSAQPADVVLRRANEVPGSTAAQRRWHIERIDVPPASPGG